MDQRQAPATESRPPTKPGLLLPPMQNKKLTAPNDGPNEEPNDSTSTALHAQTAIIAPLESPLDPDLERELFGSGPNSAVPQVDGAASASEDLAMAEAPTNNPSLLDKHLTGEKSQGSEQYPNGDTETYDESRSTINQNSSKTSNTVQPNTDTRTMSPSGKRLPQPANTGTSGKGSKGSKGSKRLPSMPPPTAPASMLSLLQPSSKAKDSMEQIKDLAAIARLISACVILFREGRGSDAKKLGQYTVDLVGQATWDEELPVYMKADPLPSDSGAVIPLLSAAVEIIKPYDRTSSAFLEGMLYVWS